MTENEFSQVQIQPRPRRTQELRKNYNSITIKDLLKTEAQNIDIVQPIEGSSLEATVKLANYNNYSHEGDEDLGSNFVKSKLVKFHSNAPLENSSSSQNENASVMFEKIPKIETIILSDDDEPPSFSNEEEDGPYNIDMFVDGDLNSDPDPERDPFADVDCDPSFSQDPRQIHNNSDDFELIDLADDDVNHSSINQSSPFPKNILSKATTSKSKQNPKLQCLLCLEKQCSESKLKTHMEMCKATHKNRHRFCFQCNHLFLSPSHYGIHAHRIHRIKVTEIYKQPLKCNFCSSSFVLKEDLVSHKASHYEMNSFGNTSSVKNHVQGHLNDNGPPFNCPLPNCEKVFDFNYHLRDHMKSAHSDQKQIKCPHHNCHKSFRTKDHLRRHMTFHSEERPFKCPHSGCSRVFKSKMCVANHMVLHAQDHRSKQTTGKPFKC